MKALGSGTRQTSLTAGQLWVLDDAFTQDGNALDWTDAGKDQFEVMAHIIPARSKALGAQSGMDSGLGEIKSEENLGPTVGSSVGLDFTDSAYDHSAEFLNSYVVRKSYWNKLKGTLAP